MKKINIRLDKLSFKKYLPWMMLAFGFVGAILLWVSHAATPTNVPSIGNFEGFLSVNHSDNLKTNQSSFAYFIKTRSGSRFELKFTGSVPKQLAKLASNSFIRIKAEPVANQVNKLSVNSLDPKLEILQTAQPRHSVRKVAVILLNFSDDRSQPVTPAAIKQGIFGSSASANSYFKEVSYGERSLEGVSSAQGDVFGYYTLSSSKSSCDPYQWGIDAEKVVQSGGTNLDNYDHIIHLYPDTSSSCNSSVAGGQGEVLGRNSWLDLGKSGTNYWKDGITHELVHNFGTGHANSYACTNGSGGSVAISQSCSAKEYGDNYDTMGYGLYSQRHVNNYLKHALKWLPDTNLITAKASGSYTVAYQEASSNIPQAIRIRRRLNQDSSKYQYYYIEYRRPYGSDTFAAGDPVVNGVSIRIGDDGPDAPASYLIDTTPSTANARDEALALNKTFSDPDNNISITLTAKNASTATVSVSMPTADAIPPTAPTNFSAQVLSSTQVVTSWSASPDGDLDHYDLVRNGTVIGSTIKLNYYDQPVSKNTTYQYAVRSVDTEGNVSGLSNSVTVTTPANDNDTAPPSTPSGVVAQYTTPISTYLYWTPSTDNKRVAGYIIYRNGRQVGEQNPGYNYFIDASLQPNTTYYYEVVAYDDAKNLSAKSIKRYVKTTLF